MDKFILKLYVTGQTSRSQRAIGNLRRIVAQHLPELCEIVIIDVLEQPQLAEDDKILVTPTLIKQLPPPMRRLIGDLASEERVLHGLDLFPDGRAFLGGRP